MRLLDVQDHFTVFEALEKKYRFDEAKSDLSYAIDDSRTFSRPIDTAIIGIVVDVVQTYGLSHKRSIDRKPDDYVGLSLTANPDVEQDWKLATLGSDLLNHKEMNGLHGDFIEKFPALKGSFHDTYGFRHLTPAGQIVADHLQFKRSPIRSRVGCIKAGSVASTNFQWGWHKDESVFENLRINIPITTSPEFLFQMEHQRDKPSFYSRTMSTEHLRVGHAYSFNSAKPHRVFATMPGLVDRINLVLGFSPWFDYHRETDEWRPNQFFGKKHPLQMFIDGDFFC